MIRGSKENNENYYQKKEVILSQLREVFHPEKQSAYDPFVKYRKPLGVSKFLRNSFLTGTKMHSQARLSLEKAPSFVKSIDKGLSIQDKLARLSNIVRNIGKSPTRKDTQPTVTSFNRNLSYSPQGKRQIYAYQGSARRNTHETLSKNLILDEGFRTPIARVDSGSLSKQNLLRGHQSLYYRGRSSSNGSKLHYLTGSPLNLLNKF